MARFFPIFGEHARRKNVKNKPESEFFQNRYSFFAKRIPDYDIFR